MFNFFTSTYWQPKAAQNVLSGVVDAVACLPDRVRAECDRHDITPATMATQAGQALSATANFAVATTGSLLDLAWHGLVTYGPPLAQGAWHGLTTHGPPLAQGVWNGLATYGPPAAAALGKGTVWAGTHAWDAARWGANALSTAAQEHHVKERAFEAGREVLGGVAKGVAALSDKAVEEGMPVLTHLKEQVVATGGTLLAEGRAGWDLLSGKGIDFGDLDDIWVGAVAQPAPWPDAPVQAEPEAAAVPVAAPGNAEEAAAPGPNLAGPQVLPIAQLAAVAAAAEVAASADSQAGEDPDRADAWHTAQGDGQPAVEHHHCHHHCNIDLHFYIMGAPVAAASGIAIPG